MEEVPELSDKTNSTQINRGKANRWVDKEMNDIYNNIWGDYEKLLSEKFGYSIAF